MITNKGKDIISKYLIGQAPAYASYIALGCGETPISYSTVDIKGATVLSSQGSAIVDSNGFITVELSLAATAAFLVTDKTVIIRGVDSFYDGVYSIYSVPSVAPGSYVKIQYLRQAASYTTYDTTSETIGTLAKGVQPSDSYLKKQNLTFEMFRIPIISRGYVTENNISQMVFTAELPSEERYEITEIGVYSAGANPSASNNDSRTLFSFAQSEKWQYHNLTDQASVPIPYIPTDLSNTKSDQIIRISEITNANTQPYAKKAFQANADNTTLSTNAIRVANRENLRFLNNGIFVSGDMSNLAITTPSSPASPYFTIANGNKTLNANHIHLTGTELNLNTNALTDELRVAFSTVYAIPTGSTPSKVLMAIEFAHDELATSENARFEIILQGSEDIPSNNRYFVKKKQLKDLITTSNFLWSSVKVVKISSMVIGSFTITKKKLASNKATITTNGYHGLSVGSSITITGVDSTFNGTYTITEATDTDTTHTFSYSKTATDVAEISSSGTVTGPSSNYYIALDAIRLENTTTTNALYGLTGYSVIRNANAETIVKKPNTSNLVEFRFGIGIE